MNTIIHSRSTVSFAYTLLNDAQLKMTIIGEKGITLETDESLKKCDYISVLKAIWSENDTARRVAWLRSHASELHAPLMYEQAIAEFLIAPTIDTVKQVSLPLLKSATFRVEQDSKCSKDISVNNGDAHICMDETYKMVLNARVVKILNKSIPDIAQNCKDTILANVNQKMITTAQASLATQLPSPNWIRFHGIDALMGTNSMHPESEFKKYRDEYANNMLAKLTS